MNIIISDIIGYADKLLFWELGSIPSATMQEFHYNNMSEVLRSLSSSFLYEVLTMILFSSKGCDFMKYKFTVLVLGTVFSLVFAFCRWPMVGLQADC